MYIIYLHISPMLFEYVILQTHGKVLSMLYVKMKFRVKWFQPTGRLILNLLCFLILTIHDHE